MEHESAARAKPSGLTVTTRSPLARFRVTRVLNTYHLLEDKDTGLRVHVPIAEVERVQLSRDCGFVEAIELVLRTMRCMSCWAELAVDRVGLCPQCEDSKRSAVLDVRDSIARQA